MKKIALLLAMVMLLVCVLASCNGTTEESKADTQSTAESKAEESKEPAAESEAQDDESVEPEESEEPAGPTYAEGTVEIDRSLEAKSVTAGLVTNEITSERDDGFGQLVIEDEEGNPVNKLTDGVMSLDGGSSTNEFFGIAGDPIEVIIDLGEVVDGLADFSVWTIHGSWGISAVDSVQFFVSDDGENWLPIADAVTYSADNEIEGEGEWQAYDFRVELEKGVSAQYVKFAINKIGHKWIGEVNVNIYE